jgi:undecaprenyl-diphosphatase
MLSDHLVDGHWLHAAAVGYVTLGPAPFVILLGAAWWAARREHPGVMAAALWAPVGVIAAVAANQLIERMPTVHWTAFHGLVVHSADLPAPSDHSAVAAATAAGLFLVGRRFGLLATAGWAIMALALLLAGADPEDIASGTVIGVTVTLIGFVLLEGPLRRFVARVRRTRLRSLTGAGKAS